MPSVPNFISLSVHIFFSESYKKKQENLNVHVQCYIFFSKFNNTIFTSYFSREESKDISGAASELIYSKKQTKIFKYPGVTVIM
jgi:hypothetical protein